MTSTFLRIVNNDFPLHKPIVHQFINLLMWLLLVTVTVGFFILDHLNQLFLIHHYYIFWSMVAQYSCQPNKHHLKACIWKRISVGGPPSASEFQSCVCYLKHIEEYSLQSSISQTIQYNLLSQQCPVTWCERTDAKEHIRALVHHYYHLLVTLLFIQPLYLKGYEIVPINLYINLPESWSHSTGALPCR